ncbi:hypothetical protein BGZ83_009808, partial [Gryganskiella cystojenkinii]
MQTIHVRRSHIMHPYSASTIALETSEIVSHIASFIPLWEITLNKEPVFKPKELLRLSRVSKTWRLAIEPIVWHSYSSSAMTKVPSRLKEEKSHLFRNLFFQPGDGVEDKEKSDTSDKDKGKGKDATKVDDDNKNSDKVKDDDWNWGKRFGKKAKGKNKEEEEEKKKKDDKSNRYNEVGEAWACQSKRVFYMSMVSRDQKSLEMIKKLEQEDGLCGLTRLTWTNVRYDQHSSDIRMVFRSLKWQLKTLQLKNWCIRLDFLIQHLVVLQELYFLALDGLEWCDRTHSFSDSLYDFTILAPDDAKEKIALPLKVLELSWFVNDVDESNKALTRFLDCCPELERLVVRLSCHAGPNLGLPLFETLIKTVPLKSSNMRRLELYVNVRQGNRTSYIAMFNPITSPAETSLPSLSFPLCVVNAKVKGTTRSSHPQEDKHLTALEATIPILDDSILQLVSVYTSTLQVLRLTCLPVKKLEDLEDGAQVDSEDDTERVVQLFTMPWVNLRELMFKREDRLTKKKTLSLLRSTWGCINLKTLSLEGLWRAPGFDPVSNYASIADLASRTTEMTKPDINIDIDDDYDDENNDEDCEWQPMQEWTQLGMRTQVPILQQLKKNLPRLENLSLNG